MMLLLGNSYSFYNNLDAIVVGIFADLDAPVEVQRLAEAGYTLANHDAQRLTADSAWAVAFAQPQAEVILQDQSQIPGFGSGEEFRASRNAAVALDTAAAAAGARTWFLMTWGRRDGDVTNPDTYPDYLTMQALLAEGYESYRSAASEDGTVAYIIPAGLAWQAVWAADRDPTSPDSAFYQLYVEDGSHPSIHGSWLTACTVYTAMTGRSAVGAVPPAGVNDADGLAEIAYQAVLDYPGELPWRSGDPEPPDTGDSGDDDTADTADTADTSSGTDTAWDIRADDGPCGCAGAEGPATAGILVGVGLLAARGMRRAAGGRAERSEA